MIPKSAFANDEARKSSINIEEIERTIDREKLVYKATEYTYDFRNFRRIRTFSRDIYEGKISLKEADEDQSSLVNKIKNFNYKTRPQNDNKKQEKEIFLKNLHNFFGGREKFLKAFTSKIFLISLKTQAFHILIVQNLKY